MTLLARSAAAEPLLVGFVRLAIAAPFLLGAALVSTRDWRVRAAPDALALLTMGAAMAAYQVCYFQAVALTGVAVAALLAICSSPLMIAGLAALVLRERLTASVGASLVTGVAGTTLLVIGPRGIAEVTRGFTLGALLALGAGLSYAIYAVVGKATLARMAPLPLVTSRCVRVTRVWIARKDRFWEIPKRGSARAVTRSARLPARGARAGS